MEILTQGFGEAPHLAHVSSGRTLMAPGDQSLNVRAWTLSQDLYRPVAAIAGPSHEAEALCLFPRGPAVPDALDAPADLESQPDSVVCGGGQSFRVTLVACGPLSLSEISNSTS